MGIVTGLGVAWRAVAPIDAYNIRERDSPWSIPSEYCIPRGKRQGYAQQTLSVYSIYWRVCVRVERIVFMKTVEKANTLHTVGGGSR